jgi:uncharacterized protein (TIGR02996 family)
MVGEMASMTGEANFLRTIAADPRTDVPRLVFADWLEETGRAARAEFIRVQVALAQEGVVCFRCLGSGHYSYTMAAKRRARARAERGRCDCRFVTLLRRERRLFERLRPALFPRPFGGRQVLTLGGEEGGPLPVVRFRRGFPADLTLQLRPLLAHAVELFAAAPVESVRVSDREPAGPEGGASVWLRDDADSPAALPPELFDRLKGERHDREVRYSSRAAAHADLDRAAVAWGRQRAGLRERRR